MLMHLLRCLHFFCALHDLKLRAEHIAGVHNTLADAISRNNLFILFAQVPQAERLATPVPLELLQFLCNNQPNWQSPTWRGWLQNWLTTVWPTVLGDHTPQLKNSTYNSANASTSHLCQQVSDN